MKKKLLAYQINGQTIGTELTGWSEHELNGNEPFIIIFDEDPISEGYVDISTIENWDRFGITTGNDYLVTKDQIKKIMLEKNWTGLTSQEKDLCIKYYALPDFEQPAIYLMMEQGMSQAQAQQTIIINWHVHHRKLLEVCRERWFYVKLVVASYLNFYDAEELMDLTNPLIFNFIECGRFGKEYGDQRSGLLDFIISKHDFDGQGLREQNYELNFGDYDELIDNMVKVLLHGIYIKINNGY